MIYSSWHPRQTSPAEIGQRTLRTLDALGEISPLLRQWWFAERWPFERYFDNPGKGPKMYPLEDVRSRITGIVEERVDRNDFGEPAPSRGYSVAAHNSDIGITTTASFSAHDGGKVDKRVSYRKAQLECDPDTELVSFPIFKAALLTIARIWDVRFAKGYPSCLSGRWQRGYSRIFDLTWMTYLAPELAPYADPPEDMHVERVEGGGLLLIACDETFDCNNPSHMAAADRIVASFADLNAFAEKELKDTWPSHWKW